MLRPDGILELCVGDVSGRGVGAATIMGRQRSTFRAYAYDCDSPGEMLRRMIRHVNEDEMITAACVTVDLLEGVLAYACAGHPPPLLLDRDRGTVTRLDGASSPPLGVAEAADIVEQRLSLPARVALALYTDGLVERRGESIEEGIDVLARRSATGPEVSPEAIARGDRRGDRRARRRRGAPDRGVEPAASFAIEMPATPRSCRASAAACGRGSPITASPSGRRDRARRERGLNNSIEHAYRRAGRDRPARDERRRRTAARRGRRSRPLAGAAAERRARPRDHAHAEHDGQRRDRLRRRRNPHAARAPGRGSREEPASAPLTAAR